MSAWAGSRKSRFLKRDVDAIKGQILSLTGALTQNKRTSESRKERMQKEGEKQLMHE